MSKNLIKIYTLQNEKIFEQCFEKSEGDNFDTSRAKSSFPSELGYNNTLDIPKKLTGTLEANSKISID